MKKAFLPLVLTAMLLTPVLLPAQGNAVSELDKINQQLEKVKKEQRQAAEKVKQAEKNMASVKDQKHQATKSIDELMDQIDEVGTALNVYNEQIDSRTVKLQKAGQQLEDAIERVANRDDMLRSRIRLMYTNGFVSYMDVLLSSTSFSDFLDRYDTLKSIVSQDKDILAENKNDKESVVLQKAQIEKQLAEVKGLYGKMEDQKQFLVSKEKQKEVMILSLSQQERDLEDISEETEAQLMDLARKKSALQKEANKIKEKNKKKKKKTSAYKGGKLGIPIDDEVRITSQFGYRTDPVTGRKGAMHKGVDFGAPNGTTIYAAEDGEVIVAQWWSGYGNCVIIDHGNGLWTLYGHIRNGGINVKEGQTVKRGEKIAEVGSTGKSTGNHLHFEVRINEEPVNPLGYLH